MTRGKVSSGRRGGKLQLTRAGGTNTLLPHSAAIMPIQAKAPMRITRLTLLLIACLLLPAQSHAGADYSVPAYEGESGFVVNPATVGGYIGAGLGGIVAGIPGTFVGKPREAASKGADIGYQTVGTIAGAPFYAAKKLFWDIPRSVFKSWRE